MIKKMKSPKLLDGSKIAGFIKERQFIQVRSLHGQKIFPRLVIIRDSNDPVINKYVSLKKTYGADIGVIVEDIVTDGLDAAIAAVASDSSVHGIIVQLPLKDSAALDSTLAKIPSAKDVDGLSGAGAFDSATATAINWLLASYNIELSGKSIAIVGKGRLVGAPLYRLWQSSGHQPIVFDRSSNLADLINFDIIISGTGVPHLITAEMVKPGAVLLDAGTASEGGVIVGDFADDLRIRTDLAAVTPKTGGIGPLTVAVLFDNVITAASRSTKTLPKNDFSCYN